jgi:hypothetical protein
MRVQYSSMLLAGVSLMALPHAALAQEATPTTATGIEAQASPANDGADGRRTSSSPDRASCATAASRPAP